MIEKIFDSKKPVYIVGGGTSLRGFDFSLLDKKQHIAVNAAMYDCHNAQIGFFADKRFYNDFGMSLWNFRNPKGDPYNKNDGIIYTTFEGANDDSWSDSRTVIIDSENESIFSKKILGSFSNSGLMAINLAYLLGARKIYLLGFDCSNTGEHDRYHTRYKRKISEDSYAKMIKDFKELSSYINKNVKDLEITNISENSLLNVFPRIPYKDVFNNKIRSKKNGNIGRN